jgi:hypothetical protein
MRLYDLAPVIRSKNAGPFTLTLDIFFSCADDFNKVLNSPAFAKDKISFLYDVSADAVEIHPFVEIMAIKVSVPRNVSSGAPGDRDVYGSQQHFPLANIEI